MIFNNIFENMPALYRTIQLLISLSALTCIVWLFLKYYVTRKISEREQSEGSSEYSKWIHTLYIGGIATFLLLEFIVYVVLNNDQRDNIIDTISFGATLSSLIMSVVAIIFTIVHSRNGENQLGQITQATDDLRQTASTLTEFRTIANDIDHHIDNLNDQIKSNIGQLSTDIDKKITILDGIIREVRNDTKEVRQHQLNQKITEQTVSNNEKSEKFSIVRFIMNGSYIGALTLLCCCYSKDTGKPIEFNELGDDFSKDFIDYVNGYLVASYASGIINSDGNMDKMTISYVHSNLEDLCLKKIGNFVKKQPKSELDSYLNSINIIRKYFDLFEFSKEDLEKY